MTENILYTKVCVLLKLFRKLIKNCLFCYRFPLKAIFLLCFIVISSACSKGSNDEDRRGIIQEREKIPVSTETQISMNFSEIESQVIDTSLHFSEWVCDSLGKQLNVIKQKGNYKGLSVAIGIPGKGFWKSTIGESGTQVPLSVNTKFHALSLGKIFTAALVLKLAEEGFLNLDETIDKWFPQCPRANEITITHLLNHTSGIQTYEVLYEFRLYDNNNFTEDELIGMACKYDILYPPNTFFSYSNTAYVMLGIIIKEVSGKSLDQNFSDYFIKPLNLKSTSYCSKKELSMKDIRGYNGEKVSENTQWPLTYATGPFISTPTDIVLLYNYLLSGQFLNKKSMDMMLSKMNIWMREPNTYYGKGIYAFIGLSSGNYLGHSGGHDTFRTCVFYNIENNVFVSVFSNTDAREIEPAMFSMTEKLIELIIH